jgi:hypothetical protein
MPRLFDGGATRLLAAILLACAAHGTATAGQDAVYHYRPAKELPTLRAYHQQPYWRGLAECAGMHSVLMRRFETAGEGGAASASRERSVRLLRQANERLRADRGLSEREALDLTAPVVDAGRGSAELLFRTPPPWAGAYSTEQIVDSMCAQLADRDLQAPRNTRRVSAPGR